MPAIVGVGYHPHVLADNTQLASGNGPTGKKRLPLVVASHNGPKQPGFGSGRRGVHPVIRPLAVQAELGRTCNTLLLDALAAGPDHLTERISVASERIFDCMEFATGSHRELAGNLFGRSITPIDGEDVFRLSRLLIGGMERISDVASTLALHSFAEPALYPIHSAVAEAFQITAAALPRLGDRDRGCESYGGLHAQIRKVKACARPYFLQSLAGAKTAERARAVVALRTEYSHLIHHWNNLAAGLYRTTLKNG